MDGDLQMGNDFYAHYIEKFNAILFAAIPSLRARDCSKNEKEALNYLFLLIPLLNVIIPFFWKSFAIVWSADTIAFFAMYAWKVCFLKQKGWIWYSTDSLHFRGLTYSSLHSLVGFKGQSRSSYAAVYFFCWIKYPIMFDWSNARMI